MGGWDNFSFKPAYYFPFSGELGDLAWKFRFITSIFNDFHSNPLYRDCIYLCSDFDSFEILRFIPTRYRV